MSDVALKPGEARCPGPSIQEIIRRDGDRIPEVLASESYRFLGDADIPFERYTSQSFFQREMDRMWTRTWQWACREEHIPHPGDYTVYDVGPHSVIVMRIDDGTVKAYHNACLHRGTKLRTSGTDGSTDLLKCPYHGWTWNIDGTLRTVPCRWDFPHVRDAEFSLPEVKVALWGGFVFINMDPGAQPLPDYLEVMPAHFRNWRMEDRYVAVHIQKELPCNWKLAVEAFIEAYHVMETHPQIMVSVTDANVQYDLYGDHVSRFYAAHGVQSPYATEKLSEQEILDRMVTGDRTLLNDGESGPTIRLGETARTAAGRILREQISSVYGADLSGYANTEVIDTTEYTVFPNMFLFPLLSLPTVYRFRPIGMNVDKTLFDWVFLRPVAKDGSRPPPAEPVRIGVDDSYCIVPGMDPGMGHVYDQDTNNLRAQQEGCAASRKRGATLGNYQEARIRKLHQTLDKYLES